MISLDNQPYTEIENSKVGICSPSLLNYYVSRDMIGFTIIIVVRSVNYLIIPQNTLILTQGGGTGHIFNIIG